MHPLVEPSTQPPALGEPDELLLRAPQLSAVVGVAHGFSSRHGGVSVGAYDSLNLSGRLQDSRQAVQENRRRVLLALGRPEAAMVVVRQVHADTVVEVTHQASKSIEADGIWTRDPRAVLAILVADCVPILVAHRLGEAVAAVHAGWRGTQMKIGAQMVQRLQAAGYEPKDLRVAMGPAIGFSAFEIGDDTAEALRSAYPHVPGALVRGAGGSIDAKWHADLYALNRDSLLEAGVAAENIEMIRHCTHSNPQYFSHRRDTGNTGRQGGFIACRM